MSWWPSSTARWKLSSACKTAVLILFHVNEGLKHMLLCSIEISIDELSTIPHPPLMWCAFTLEEDLSPAATSACPAVSASCSPSVERSTSTQPQNLWAHCYTICISIVYQLCTSCVPVVYQGTWSSCEKKRNRNLLGQPSASPLHPFLYLSLGQTSDREVFILISNTLVLYQDLKVFQSFHLLRQQKIQSITHLRAYVICWL